MLKGALVEVHFEFRHFCIKKKNKDSFNASVQQVIILQPGKAQPANTYKQHNILDRPMRPSPTLTCLNKEIGGGTCASPVENTELTISSGMATLHSVSLLFSSHVVFAERSKDVATSSTFVVVATTGGNSSSIAQSSALDTSVSSEESLLASTSSTSFT
jgi:hypothetical protein